uniref:Secreted protein n=1 Tax=Macrostomum lignano TaxID=282301 RepID=A0A1I8FHA3_9PLAT
MPVLRIPGRREQHTGRSARQAHTVELFLLHLLLCWQASILSPFCDSCKQVGVFCLLTVRDWNVFYFSTGSKFSEFSCITCNFLIFFTISS